MFNPEKQRSGPSGLQYGRNRYFRFRNSTPGLITNDRSDGRCASRSGWADGEGALSAPCCSAVAGARLGYQSDGLAAVAQGL